MPPALPKGFTVVPPILMYAYQSSNPQTAALAIDANISTCSNTTAELTPWLTVDMGAPYMVAGLRLTATAGRY